MVTKQILYGPGVFTAIKGLDIILKFDLNHVLAYAHAGQALCLENRCLKPAVTMGQGMTCTEHDERQRKKMEADGFTVTDMSSVGSKLTGSPIQRIMDIVLESFGQPETKDYGRKGVFKPTDLEIGGACVLVKLKAGLCFALSFWLCSHPIHRLAPSCCALLYSSDLLLGWTVPLPASPSFLSSAPLRSSCAQLCGDMPCT